MKEPYDKDLASHVGPESCGGPRKGSVEALTGVRVGRVLSRESYQIEVLTMSSRRKATRAESLWQDSARPHAVPRPRACTEPTCTRTGRSRDPP